MKPELQDQLLAALKSKCREALNKMVQAGGAPGTDERLIEYMVNEVLDTMPNVRKLKEELPGMDDSRFEEMRKEFETGFEPYLRKNLAKTVKLLAHARGGRPSSLKGEKKSEVCRLVLTLIGQGRSERIALAEAAKMHGVSIRTVERTWKKRATFLSTPSSS